MLLCCDYNIMTIFRIFTNLCIINNQFVPFKKKFSTQKDFRTAMRKRLYGKSLIFHASLHVPEAPANYAKPPEFSLHVIPNTLPKRIFISQQDFELF